MNSWTLRLLGDSLSADNSYIYTDEFAGFSADAERQILTDEGGVDTLNGAALSADAVLNLVSGATSILAGNTLTISADTVIENAYSGDGNDQITGNSAANILSCPFSRV